MTSLLYGSKKSFGFLFVQLFTFVRTEWQLPSFQHVRREGSLFTESAGYPYTIGYLHAKKLTLIGISHLIEN